MRLSNAELQEAIKQAHWIEQNSTGSTSAKAYAHLVRLLEEQSKRAEDRTELSLAPMETTVERAEFDARVRAQEPPWIECTGGIECPVEDDTPVIVKYRDGGSEKIGSPQYMRWENIGTASDIVAYKKIEM